MACKKILKLAVPSLFDRVNLYVHDDESITYKFTDGKRFESLEVFKDKFRKHFKREPNIEAE